MTDADIRNLSRRQLDDEIEQRERVKRHQQVSWDCLLGIELDELCAERRVRRLHAQGTRLAA